MEICITRITSAIRETESIEKHGKALIDLWESCLEHNLKPFCKDEDTPHAKIASDIMSCILQVRLFCLIMYLFEGMLIGSFFVIELYTNSLPEIYSRKAGWMIFYSFSIFSHKGQRNYVIQLIMDKIHFVVTVVNMLIKEDGRSSLDTFP